MAIISAFTLIRGLSLFHITAGYCFMANPRLITEQNIVVILGEAMHLPQVTSLAKATDATAFLGLVLAFLGATDLVAANMSELTALEYWTSQTPVRLFLLFAITGYTYLFKDDGLFGSGASVASRFGKNVGVGAHLRNDLVFTAGFVEACLWFWVYVLLREERTKVAVRMAEKRAAEADSL